MTSGWRKTKSRLAALRSSRFSVVLSRGRGAAAGTLPQRVSGRRAASSPSTMAVAAVGRPGAARCSLLRLLSFLLVAGPALCWNDPGECRLAGARHLRRCLLDQFPPVCPLLAHLLLGTLSGSFAFLVRTSRSGRGARISSENFSKSLDSPVCPLFSDSRSRP